MFKRLNLVEIFAGIVIGLLIWGAGMSYFVAGPQGGGPNPRVEVVARESPRPFAAPVPRMPIVAERESVDPIAEPTEAKREPIEPKMTPRREFRVGDLVVFDDFAAGETRFLARSRRALALLRLYEVGGFSRDETKDLLRKQLVFVLPSGDDARVVEVGTEYLRVRLRGENSDLHGYVKKEYVHVK